MGESSLSRLFEQELPEGLARNRHRLKDIRATYQFDIHGEGSGVWTLRIDGGEFEVTKGGVGDADCTVRMEASQFLDMVNGKLAGRMAFITRKLKVEGDIGLALKLETIVRSSKSASPSGQQQTEKISTVEKKLMFEKPPEATAPVVLPGIYDALSARMAQDAGFEAVVFSGYAASASLMAKPDFGLLTQTEVIRSAQYIAEAVDIPLIVDGDTGYGGPINVIRSVRELERAGAQGMILEDQLWPKRCGHMVGKEVIPMEEYEQKLLAALEARTDPERFLITARTDALGPEGVDEAIRRANRYRELGASAVFVEAPTSKAQLKTIRESVEGPLVANMIEGGLTPILSLEEFAELGYQFVGFPLSSIFSVAHSLRSVFKELKETGSTSQSESAMVRFDEFAKIVRLQETYNLEQRYSLPRKEEEQ